MNLNKKLHFIDLSPISSPSYMQNRKIEEENRNWRYALVPVAIPVSCRMATKLQNIFGTIQNIDRNQIVVERQQRQNDISLLFF